MRIYMPLQILQRELDSRLLLAAHLSAHGHQVFVGPRPGLLAHRRTLGPGGIYLLSNADRKSFIRGGSVDDLALVVLDEEVLVVDEGTFVDERVKPEMVDRCAIYFCWGDHHRDLLLERFPGVAHWCAVVGNPRVDLLEARFRPLYSHDVARLQTQFGGRIVLFNATEDLDSLRRGTTGSGFLGAARALARSAPDVAVVLRPHPAGGDVAHQVEPDLPNLHITNEGPIAPWMLAARVVIHPGCTTAIEARLLGRPTIHLRSSGTWTMRSLAEAVSHPVESSDELIATLNGLPDGLDIPQPSLEVLDDHIFRDDDCTAAERISAAIGRLEPPVLGGRIPFERPTGRERLRWVRRGPKDKHWSHIELRRNRRALRRRFRLISEVAGLEHRVRIAFPQPRVMAILPRTEEA